MPTEREKEEMTKEAFQAWSDYNTRADNNMTAVVEPPQCHFTGMNLEDADDGSRSVQFWECRHCGHTKDAGFNII